MYKDTVEIIKKICKPPTVAGVSVSPRLIKYLLFGSVVFVVSVVVVVVVVVDCSFSKPCTMARRFCNACFKLVRKTDRGSPFPFGVVVVAAVVVAQINATNNRKVFILMLAKTVN